MKNPTANSQQQIEVMLELLRSAVLDRDPVLDFNVEVDWDNLMDLASKQGILAWVYDGICKLPKEQQPPRQQRINWALSAQEIWDRYHKQKEVLADMVKVCDENDMRMLLLKGIGLSELYPKPESRPSGDIDVYFFGEYEKGNEIFSSGEVKERKKECEFEYQGATIENHRTFVNIYSKHMAGVQMFLEESLVCSSRNKSGYYEFPTEANLLFLVEHASNHLKYDDYCSLNIRSILDISMFVVNHNDLLTPIYCKQLLDRYKIAASFELFLKLGSLILDFDFSSYYYETCSGAAIEKAKNIILSSWFSVNSMPPFFFRLRRIFLLSKFFPSKRVKGSAVYYLSRTYIRTLVNKHRSGFDI